MIHLSASGSGGQEVRISNELINASVLCSNGRGVLVESEIDEGGREILNVYSVNDEGKMSWDKEHIGCITKYGFAPARYEG